MSFVWTVELSRPDGSFAARAPLEPDWGPASIWVRFEGMRRGVLPPVISSAPGDVEPRWADDAGAPYVGALRVAISADGDGAIVREEIPVSYLRRQVVALTRSLAAAGELAPGEVVYPRVCAEPIERRASVGAVARVGGFAIAEIPRPLALRETSMASFLRRATPCDLAEGDTDVPIFVPTGVLEEAEALSTAAGDVETGGFLFGHLHRDPSLPEIFVEITAQVPAEHVLAERARITFTPKTWAAAEAARRVRGREETLVSWWHFHPDFCANCPPERREQCTLDSTFFSAEDVSLHHLFGQAHQTALLISAKGSSMTRAFFGWRAGTVASRGYYVTRE